MFCQLELLCQSFPSSVRRILEELPEGLDETYERVLREIRKANQGHACRLLQCLVAAVRPLHVEELAEVIAVDFDAGATPMLNPGWRWSDQQEAVLSACSSLVMIVEDGASRIVQFSHFSVKEYLMSSRLAESSKAVSRHHIQLELAHTILTQACLGVLLKLDDGIDGNNIDSFPLARYAAQHWVEHAKFGNVASRIEDGMDCLFDADKPYFAIWLWIYNKDRPSRSLPSTRPSKPQAVPLYYAALHGFRDLAKRLLAKHPEHLNAEGGGSNPTSLYVSASRGHYDIFSLLIDHLPAVDILHGWGRTALHVAAWRGQLEIGQQLLVRGADSNARDVSGWTPLHIAADWGKFEFAHMLLEHKAQIDARTDAGDTPLHRASQYGHVKAVELFLEYGASIGVHNKEGRTPSELGWRHPEVGRLITEYGGESQA